MTGPEMRDWRKGLKLSRRAAAEALGISESQIIDYEAGTKRGTDRAALIPKHIALACAAISRGITTGD